jgi:hypothetical protein
MKNLLSEFDEVRKNRLKYRKKVIKTLRENKQFFETKNYGYLIRKMNWNYMGDLSDPKLLFYLRMLVDAENKIAENNKTEKVTFSEDSIVL